MNNGEPAFKSAEILCSDAEDLIEDVGRGPDQGLEIENIGANAGDSLGFLQGAGEVAEGLVGVAGRDLIVHWPWPPSDGANAD